jgi:hypothetical protein
MKQISIETGHTYGKRRLKHHLNAKGHQIGIISDITYPVSIALLLVKVTIKQIVCRSV